MTAEWEGWILRTRFASLRNVAVSCWTADAVARAIDMIEPPPFVQFCMMKAWFIDECARTKRKNSADNIFSQSWSSIIPYKATWHAMIHVYWEFQFRILQQSLNLSHAAFALQSNSGSECLSVTFFWLVAFCVYGRKCLNSAESWMDGDPYCVVFRGSETRKTRTDHCINLAGIWIHMVEIIVQRVATVILGPITNIQDV